MATNANPYVVNIVDLQNISLSISGTSQASQLTQAQTDISNLQKMVSFSNKTINADTIASFTSGNTIQVISDMNLSNPISFTSISTNTSVVGSGTSYINVNNTTSTISFINAGVQPLNITSTGDLQYTSSSTYFSTGVHVAGWLYVSESAYVKNLYQTSDKELKINIQPFSTCLTHVLQLEPCTFNWKDTGKPDIGFIAQDVKNVWPGLVTEDSNMPMGIAYSRFIPLLLESIRELNERVTVTESTLKTHLRNCTHS